ncbi:hypothetical protein [Tardiphaga sp. 709]|uniref:hypothetical protein n=1 Tax=Tardiphaga sp. 709 TaxID=3076039 RepID=UPI0028E3AF62|nr:hypothetical protein [Tardiphaga sp. 709]WNV09950.1 hypothetical protein RSO67_01775 [Tardiphaga sp. 709]
MATPVTDPAVLEQLNGGRKPVADPALLAQLNGETKDDGFALSKTVTDIPREIGATADRNLTAIESGLSNRGSKGPIEGLLNTGSAVMGGLGLAASPVVGAIRSVGGHGLSWLTHKAGELIAPEIAAKDDPQKMYETAASDVETSLLAAKPGVKAPPVVAAPTVAELKAASRAAYQSPEIAAVRVDPRSTANLATKIENDLLQKGFRQRSQPEVFEEIKALTPPTLTPKQIAQGYTLPPVEIADLHSSQKALGLLARERDAVGAPTPKAAAAAEAKRALDDYLPNIPASDVLAGDAARASEILKEASSNWGAAKRGEQVDLQLTRAERQAAKSGMGGNVENAMRQKIATILDNPKRTSGFSKDEIKAMEDIVRGTKTRNTLRSVGKLGVDGGLSLMLNTGAALGSGGATIPVTVMGTIARLIGQKSTAKAGAALSELVRSRSPMATGNKGVAAVSHALSPALPSAQLSAIPYSSIASAMMASPQRR